MTPEEIYNGLHERFGERIVSYSATAVDPYIVSDVPVLHAVGTYLRYDSAMQFDSLMCLSGVDYGPGKSLGVVYNLHSTTFRHKITLKVEVPRHDGVVPTVSDLWHTAEWHEREAYDLFGMRFEGHPDHRRILLPDDWEGHPLLKDYQVQEFYHGIKGPVRRGPPEHWHGCLPLPGQRTINEGLCGMWRYLVNIWESVKTPLIGMRLTWKRLFVPAVTLQYPEGAGSCPRIPACNCL